MFSWFRKPRLTSKAIAYLKADVSSERDAGAAVTLPPDDTPVMKNLGNGLLSVFDGRAESPVSTLSIILGVPRYAGSRYHTLLPNRNKLL
jgi:hypothetical protein